MSLERVQEKLLKTMDKLCDRLLRERNLDRAAITVAIMIDLARIIYTFQHILHGEGPNKLTLMQRKVANDED